MALKSAFATLKPGRAVASKPRPKAASVKPLGPARPAGSPLLPAAAAQPPPGAAVPAINPQFGADVNAAGLNLSTTLQRNQAQRGQLGSTYGFSYDSKADNNVVDDHTDPFSRAAALQTAYDQSVRGTTNSMAARGQLYSGATQNAQNWNATQNLKGRDSLIREFMGARQSLDQSDVDAQNAYSNAVTSAQAAAAQYALEQARAESAATAAVPQAAAAAAGPGPSAQDRANAAYGGPPRIKTNYKAPSGQRGTLKTYPNGKEVFVPNG